MGSELIRVKEEIKGKLDHFREGQTVEGKYGYMKQMKYSDAIRVLLNNIKNDYTTRAKYELVKAITGDYDTSPDKVLDFVVRYLDIYLRTTSTKQKNYGLYCSILDYLGNQVIKINKDYP